MNVTVKCTNVECLTTMDVPFVVGSVYPSIGALCAVCNRGMLVITEIRTPNVQNNRSIISQHPKLMEEIVVSHQVLEDEHYLRGPNVLTAFQNRISPLIVILQLMKEHGEEEGKIHFQELRRHFINASNLIFKHLDDEVESNMNVKRGQKLSDGFPPVSKEGPLRIVMRNMIGIDEGRIFHDRGLLQSLGLIKVIDGDCFQLTERAQVFTDLPNIHQYLTAITRLETVSINPVLPEYYGEDLAHAILGALFSVAKDQKAWTLHILHQIAYCKDVEVNGWDSNHYAYEETLKIANGEIRSRWTHQSGMSLYEKYLAQGRRQGKHVPEYHASSRLEKHINGKLGSLLSLFKELGLVEPISIGNTKNYAITDRGMRVLEENTEVNL